MKNLAARLNLALSIALASLFTQGCAKQPLQALEPFLNYKPGTAALEAQFCTTPATEYRQRLKYVVIMDKSASNQEPPDANDPNGFRRYAPLQSFLTSTVADPGYTFFSLINFSTSASVVRGFTDDLTSFRQTVTSQWNAGGPQRPADWGYTNYLSALDAARNLIIEDIDRERGQVTDSVVTSVYTIIFISDGYPFVVDTASPTGVSPQIYDPDIRNRISTILNVRTDTRYRAYVDEIILHTGYYFENNDPAAQTLLAEMAAQGGGKAFQFGSGVNIDYSLFAVPVRNVRLTLSDVLVENRSGTWWDDGRFLRDSDFDGLPDEIEAANGSDLRQADSDGNGVSDFVEYRTKGRACRDPSCARQVLARDNYAICQGLLPPQAPNGGPNPAPDGVNLAPYGTSYFLDRDRDGLNDCEELIMQSQLSEFDSNRDGVPDFLAMKNQLGFISTVNFSTADPDADGRNNYDEIKVGMPIFVPTARMLGVKPMTYDLQRGSGAGSTDCYRLRVDDVTTVGPDNLIRVYFIQNTSVIDNRRTLRVVAGRLVGFESFINFSVGNL